MGTREAYVAVQAAEQGIKLPRHLTVESLRDYLSAERNREIVIDELVGLSGADVCGMWLPKEDRDVILHAPTRSPLHREHIVLHEFGHMILKHDLTAIPVEPSPGLISGMGLTTMCRVFLRTSFSVESELAAELFADRLAVRIMKSGHTLAPEHLAFGEVFG
ncbi:hypothetical protein [Arthrobacter wenxiniae]|uniref:hypothetical protein n=1 Tax=Arthrobacter wenxiniae TaxID=2713570 RepID=UPI001C401090|nr:hypothetical protein [Arthrobacter wenxiniae]